MKRRHFFQASLALGTLGSMVGCATTGRIPNRAKVHVIGGGYGGATAAKYVRMLSNYKIDVAMVEPNTNFVSCPAAPEPWATSPRPTTSSAANTVKFDAQDDVKAQVLNVLPGMGAGAIAIRPGQCQQTLVRCQLPDV